MTLSRRFKILVAAVVLLTAGPMFAVVFAAAQTPTSTPAPSPNSDQKDYQLWTCGDALAPHVYLLTLSANDWFNARFYARRLHENGWRAITIVEDSIGWFKVTGYCLAEKSPT